MDIFSPAIFYGDVSHRRYVGADHQFTANLFMLWLPVKDMDSGVKWPMISRGSVAPVSVVAGDYMSHRGEVSLSGRLTGEILEKTGKSWDGQAFALTHPRHFGFVMNPLTVYYCYDDSGALRFVVGEITNTPWNERHCYVFDMSGAEAGRPRKFTFPKAFHVSPFLPMDMTYKWLLSPPGERVSVGIWNLRGDTLDFEAHLNLRREPLNVWSLTRRLIFSPLMTWRVWLGIYVNAGVLYAIKRVKFYDNPKLSSAPSLKAGE